MAKTLLKNKSEAATLQIGEHKFKIEILGEEFNYVVFEISSEDVLNVSNTIMKAPDPFKIKKKRGHFSGHASSIKYELPKPTTRSVMVHLGFVLCS